MKKRKARDPRLIQIGNKLISEDLKDEMFACDISACKGACCVEGDIGAPLDRSELAVLEDIYPKVKPFLREEGVKAIEDQGSWINDWTGGISTPLVDGNECAYVTFSEDGVALCGIEQAYEAGEVDFKKPVSCHLYPIRVEKSKNFETLSYDRWEICSAACLKGKVQGVKVYEFTKDAIIRAYGDEFWNELDVVVKALDGDHS
ncbi:MAG: DUF3109 family protein [Bacteroidia bacterium]|nr:DUF3109 family protein [Bacteroidia bacterium]